MKKRDLKRLWNRMLDRMKFRLRKPKKVTAKQLDQSLEQLNEIL